MEGPLPGVQGPDLKPRDPMHPELEDLIKSSRPLSPGPVDRAYLAAFEAGERDPSDEVLDRLPQGPGESNLIGKVATFMANRFPDDMGLPAISRLAAGLLARGWLQSQLVAGFFETLVSRAMDEPGLQEQLIAFSRALGVPDGNLAKLIAVKAGHRLEFGWTSELQETTPSLRIRRAWGTVVPPATSKDIPPAGLITGSRFERFLLELDDPALSDIALTPARGGLGSLVPLPKLLSVIAAFRPEAFRLWVEAALRGERGTVQEWTKVLAMTDRWDAEFLEASRKLDPAQRLSALLHLEALRPGKARKAVREAALDPAQTETGQAMAALAVSYPDEFIPTFIAFLRGGTGVAARRKWSRVSGAFTVAARRWQLDGKALYQALLDCATGHGNADLGGPAGASAFALAADAIPGLLAESSAATVDEIRAWTDAILQALGKAELSKEDRASACERIWCELIDGDRGCFLGPLAGLLGDDRKQLRGLAIEGLRRYPPDLVLAAITEPLRSGKTKQRLGAAELLAELPAIEASALLQEALDGERNEEVRAVLHQALKARSRGGADRGGSFAGLEAMLAEKPAKIKVSVEWQGLPALAAADGTPLPANAIAFLVSKQSKHKAIEAAPDILPLLAHIDRGNSAPFALALVEGFLNSGQAASDRWALTLGGLLGDNRIIPPLLSRIPDWCENSRHKLAEYAVQAIALLPGNEPLMVLDSLSNRYRSKFKNVGKACAEAFNAAAAARGITADELGDMVVPDFGFDGGGIRRFEWDGGGASAELGADFKLSWFDPDTDKAWNSLPANAPAAVKDEVKTLGKLLREAVKAQTARLEMTLVRQRRWPVARWRELFENHPLLRSFASSLVWGIYDASGTLLRTFRRYPNGLLANAAGELEELPEADTMIGMVHPLELETAALDAWRAHLGRFKVKQPFPQIDRPVELMDPLHGNRREIALTKGGKVSAGTFRSRSEKRGWTRGSVIDGGGISSYYKLYPGAGVEVVLPTDNFYIGIDPMDTVELGAAYFATAGSVERGSYTYDEPAPDDPRVLRFDQVPAVVWSETMSDLKAILGT